MPVLDGVAEEDITNWKEFKSQLYERIDAIRKGSFTGAAPVDPKGFVFRGQACKSWKLETAFARKVATKTHAGIFDADSEYEAMVQRFFEENIYHGIEEQPPTMTVPNFRRFLEEKAQHHGLPTRLLDWSDSPYIASFFAVSEERNCSSGWWSVWAIDTAEIKRCFNSSEVDTVRNPFSNNQRMRMQQGMFTQSTSNLTSLEDVFKLSNRRHRNGSPPRYPVLFKFNMPQSEAAPAIEDLGRMGISFVRLFPGIEGLCKQFEYELWQKLK